MLMPMTLGLVLTLVAGGTGPRGSFGIDWFTIDGGGALFTTAGNFELSGTIGQPDAGPVMTGGNFELVGGFWPGIGGPLPGDFDGDGDVDLSDFVTFQLCFGGSNNPPAATCPPGVDADLDGDGDVDLADFLIFQQNFTGSL